MDFRHKTPLRASNAWLEAVPIQSRVAALGEALGKFSADLVGINYDNARRVAVVVFHQDFSGYADAQRDLSHEVASPEVELRPACRPRRDLDEALRVLSARNWHAEENRTPIGWHLDVAFAGNLVTVDDSAPEVADTLRAQLGSAVFVRLGKPRRHSLANSSPLR